MKAMVLAAGVGSRLRPLTDSVPKALVEVGGRPMLESVLRRLINAGVREAIVNTHHHAPLVADFLKANNYFGIRIELSHEPQLLDTGGGLKKAAWFFDDGKPFLLHNTDVLTNTDLRALLAAHERSGALATLAVSSRQSMRRLLFDSNGLLCGRQTPDGVQWAGANSDESAARFAFNGIHALSPQLLQRIGESGVFPITETYLRLAGEGVKIGMLDCSACDWFDIGSPAALERARTHAAAKGLPE